MHLGHAKRCDTTLVQPGEAQAPSAVMMRFRVVVRVLTLVPFGAVDKRREEGTANEKKLPSNAVCCQMTD